jgi:hypothetical protein
MKVKDLVESLLKVDQNKEVEILGQVEGRVLNNELDAISLNPVSGVIEYEDYVAILRLI